MPMVRPERDSGPQSAPRPTGTGRALSILFGLSVAIAVLDRLPVLPLLSLPVPTSAAAAATSGPAISISAYRVLHLPLLLAIVLLLFARRRIRWTLDNPTLLLLAGLMLTMILSTLGAPAARQLTALLNLLRYLEYSFIAALLFLVLRNCWRPAYWVPFSWALLLAALLSSITVLTDFWNLTAFYRWYTATRPYVRHIGVLGEANYGAAKLCVLLPFILFLEGVYLRRQEWGKVSFIGGTIMVVCLVIFISGSRMGGLIAVLILLAFGLRESRWLRRPRVLLALSLALGVLTSSLLLLPQRPLLQASRYLTDRYGIVLAFLRTGEERFRGVHETSLQERIAVQRAGLRIFADHPLVGVGPGNFPLVIGDYDAHYTGVYSHNTYLSALVELGLVGCLLFVLLCLRMLVTIHRLARAPTSAPAAAPPGSSPGLKLKAAPGPSPGFYSYLLLSYLALLVVLLFLHDLDSKYLWTLFLPVALYGDSRALPRR